MNTGCTNDVVDVKTLRAGDFIKARINAILYNNGGISVSIGDFHGVLFSNKQNYQGKNGPTAEFEEGTKKSLSPDKLSPAERIVHNRHQKAKTGGKVMPRPVETRATYGILHPNQPEVPWARKREKTRREVLAEKNRSPYSGGLPSHKSNCTCDTCVELRSKRQQAILNPECRKRKICNIDTSSEQCLKPSSQKISRIFKKSKKIVPAKVEKNSKSLKVIISPTDFSPKCAGNSTKNVPFKVKDVVWSRMRGYPWWPAVINSIKPKANGGNLFNVKWCGYRNQTSDVTVDKLLDFKQHFTKIYPEKKKPNNAYKKAIEEAKKMVKL